MPPPRARRAAPATAVVNNNAAAVLLALNTLAEGGEVIVSRGELVEIGGSFRIPEVMGKSGATLREVGTTNRTRIDDYGTPLANARGCCSASTAPTSRSSVSPSSLRWRSWLSWAEAGGFPSWKISAAALSFHWKPMGISGEPTVQFSLRAGVDIVTYSGDKLLGGPQAGILSGRPAVIARVRANPLFRALRVDKLIYSMLESTLLAYVRQQYEAIPALRFMRIPGEELLRRAEALADATAGELPPAGDRSRAMLVAGGRRRRARMGFAQLRCGDRRKQSARMNYSAGCAATILQLWPASRRGACCWTCARSFPAEEPEIVAALQRIDSATGSTKHRSG